MSKIETVKMAGSRRLKRVTWPSDVNLCKVRLFLSEEAPYQSGLGTQDQLQPKGSASFLQHASAGPTDDSALPPGFESPAQQSNKRNQTDVSKIPLIKWRPPVKIVLNPEWYVVSGEESQEMSKQNKRNFGVLEAIYPRQSTVPPNPSISKEAQQESSQHNDDFTPTVPLTATEEDDSSDPSDPSDPFPPKPSQPPQSNTNSAGPVYDGPGAQPDSSAGLVYGGPGAQAEGAGPVYGGPGAQADGAGPVYGGPGAQADVARFLAGLGSQPDVTAAVSAAVTALTRSTEQGSLIDQNLLIQILSDPSLVEKLVSQNPNPNPNPNPSSSRGMSVSVSAPPLPPGPPPLQIGVGSFSYVRNPNPNANPNPNSRPFPVSAPGPPPPLPPQPPQYSVPLFNPNPNSRPGPPFPPNPNSRPPPPLPPPSFSVLRPNMQATPMTTQPPHNMATPMATQAPPHMATQMATQAPPNMQATQMATQMNQGNRNYYMNLIQQHGGEYAINNNNSNNQKSGVKIQKPCAYFNSPKGCRHGASCMFLHENINDNMVESIDERNKKRVKVDSNDWYL